MELLLSVSILSLGLMFIVRAFSFSAHATGLSCDMLTALLLAKDKMQEYEFFENSHTLDTQPAVTSEKKDKFTWSATLDPDPDAKIYGLCVRISWQRAKKEQKIDICTYLR